MTSPDTTRTEYGNEIREDWSGFSGCGIQQVRGSKADIDLVQQWCHEASTIPALRERIRTAQAEAASLRIRLQEAEREIERLGRGPSDPGSQASPEAPSDLRPEGVDPSRMQWQPIDSIPEDGTRVLLDCWIWLHPVVGYCYNRDGIRTIREHGSKAQVYMASYWKPLARANDERAQRENAERSSPKDASVVTEGQAPEDPSAKLALLTQEESNG